MGPRVHNRSIFDPKISIFLRYTHITPIFGVRRIRPNGILSPPYPEVTLDNFSFPVGGRLAAPCAVFWPPSQILANFGSGHLRRESTPNFDPILTKFGQIVRVTQKIILYDTEGGLNRKNGETTVFAFGRKS